MTAFNRSLLFQQEPAWIPARPGEPLSGEPVINSWLQETGSLTARLKANCCGGFGVRVLRQAWMRPYPGEAGMLALRMQRNALVREVVLHCHGRPLVLARSVIPKAALRGTQCRLAHLGNRPLGELLFSYPRLARLSLEWARIGKAQWRPMWHSQMSSHEEVWGRRSVYAVARGHILVCEFFLPAIVSVHL